jgi:protease-4
MDMRMASPLDWNADYLTDRRALRRKLTAWRVVAFSALIAIAVVAGWRIAAPGAVGSFQTHIARVSIDGVITGDRETLRMLDDVAKSSAVAVILSIESPGGTTTGAERLYDAIRRVAEKKPVVAVVRGMAASGAYIAALGADRIVAQGNSLVGSIGVLVQIPNVGKLLDFVGVKMEEVKSSPLKAAPNGMEPTSPEARAALEAIVGDSFQWFRSLVQSRRGMNDAEIAAVADGRIFTGRQGIGLKLIDATGSELDAIAWLRREKNIAANLPVRDWRPSRRLRGFGILGAAAGVAGFLGMEPLAAELRRVDITHGNQQFDGLLSLWQFRVIN